MKTKHILILIIIIIMVIYKIPTNVQRTYNGYMDIGKNQSKKIQIKFNGKIKRNITMQNKITGTLNIDGISMEIQSNQYIVSFTENFKHKFEDDYYTLHQLNNSGSDIGRILMPRNLKMIFGRLSALDEKYNENVYFFAPTDNKDDILNIYDQITGSSLSTD
ncbi:hypothetical protein [Abyssisolibacter fermentans]|uniref:hypothetical protein n=1 Tax=Abyssisolibacter fermentans TaxID=1766203 RepID=UPI00082CC8C7|nr:hypothetical protein [Abyssisolibacter fermentans]